VRWIGVDVGDRVEDVASSRTLSYAFAGGRFIARGSSVFRPRRWVSSTESKPPPRRDGEDAEPIRVFVREPGRARGTSAWPSRWGRRRATHPRAASAAGMRKPGAAVLPPAQKPPAVSDAAVENNPL